MSIRTISTGQLRRMGDQEGLVLQGCGGDPQEWVDGINEILAQEGILKKGAGFEEAYSQTAEVLSRNLGSRTVLSGSVTQGKDSNSQSLQKLLYLKEGQYSPNHFHWYKTEDIINCGGGNVLIKVYNSLPDESIDYESDVTVHTDGRTYTVPAGSMVRLTPGESIHVQQYLYHDFNVEEGTGAVLLAEVSQCNDDNTDNRLNPPVGRFPEIEEDESPYRLLCNEYPAAK